MGKVRRSRHPRYKWEVYYKEAGKNRTKYSNRKKDLEDFREECLNEASEFGAEAFVTAAERAAIVEYRERLDGAGLNIRRAFDLALERVDGLARSKPVSEVWQEYVDDRRRANRGEYYIRTDLIGKLRRFADEFGDRMAADIQAAEISDWIHGLKAGPTTKASYLRLCVGLFNFAISRDYASVNPAAKVSRPKAITSPAEILTTEEASHLLTSVPEETLPVFLIGLFCGLRTAELRRLRWEDVDLPGGHVEVRAENAKTATRRLVEIRPHLKAWLSPLARTQGFVWPGEQQWREAREKAAKGFKGGKWKRNCLRHSFASYHLVRWKDANALALEMGHTTTSLIFSNYRELVRPEAAKAFWSIKPNASGEKKS